METTRFLRYEPGQMLLLPPDLREWLEEGHLAYFILDVVEALGLSEIFASYDGSRGDAPDLILASWSAGAPQARRGGSIGYVQSLHGDWVESSGPALARRARRASQHHPAALAAQGDGAGGLEEAEGRYRRTRGRDSLG
jgi:hypothetical protein